MTGARAVRAAAAFGLATAGMTAALAGAGQDPQQQRPPVFRSSAELVEVDVVVRDADGNPVLGLTPDDFVVLDRRQPQTIETFREVQPEPDPDGLPDLPPDIYIDVSSNTSDRAGRLVVVVLDDLHTYRGRTDVVKGIARDVVEKLGPESSMALIQTGGDHNVEVTQNRARLFAAINQFEGRQATRRPMEACEPVIDRSTGEGGYSASLGCDEQQVFANMRLYESLEGAARLLAASDKRRKAFILVSENVAKDLSGIFQVSVARDTTTPDAIGYAGGGGAEALGAGIAGVAYHDNELLDMMDAMRRGNVATFSIDPRGEISGQDLMEECFGPGAGDFNDPCLGGTRPDWNAWVRQAQQGLELLSEASGGFAVVNTDDFGAGIDDIITDLDYYYLLGFYTGDTESTGYRRLEVRVRNRPDLTLRFRQGYQIGADDDEESDDVSPLAKLVNGALPSNDIPMQLFGAAMPYSDREARVAVALQVTVPRANLQTENQRLLDDIEYGLFAIDLDGSEVREQVGHGASIVLRPRDPNAPLPDDVTYAITSVMQLPPGEYQLRASATSARLALGGSVYLPFTVPDYSRYAMGLTDLVLSYEDGPRVPVASSQGRSQIPAANLLPFEPSLDRVFHRSDTLRLFFQVVQRDPRPATVTIQVLGSAGHLLLGQDVALEAESRVRVDRLLPLDRLTPGVYRLRVAVDGESGFAERDLGFIVR